MECCCCNTKRALFLLRAFNFLESFFFFFFSLSFHYTAHFTNRKENQFYRMLIVKLFEDWYSVCCGLFFFFSLPTRGTITTVCVRL